MPPFKASAFQRSDSNLSTIGPLPASTSCARLVIGRPWMAALIVFVISTITFRNFCVYYCRSMSAEAASSVPNCEG